ncbi:hypothetical protein ACKWTF_001445 [Chironomus riparius]
MGFEMMLGTTMYVARFRIELINSIVKLLERWWLALEFQGLMNRINYNGRSTMTNLMSKSKNICYTSNVFDDVKQKVHRITEIPQKKRLEIFTYLTNQLAKKLLS